MNTTDRCSWRRLKGSQQGRLLCKQKESQKLRRFKSISFDLLCTWRKRFKMEVRRSDILRHKEEIQFSRKRNTNFTSLHTGLEYLCISAWWLGRDSCIVISLSSRCSSLAFPPRRPGFKPGSSHVGFCDGQKWRWDRFSPSTSVSPANLYCTIFSTITITYHPGLAQ
jgi:hypothetical protein